MVLPLDPLRQASDLTSTHASSNVGIQRRKTHWPSFLYFYCRYSIWLAVIGMNIALNVTTKVNCQALVRALFVPLTMFFENRVTLSWNKTVRVQSIYRQHGHRICVDVTHVAHHRSLEPRSSGDGPIGNCIAGAMGDTLSWNYNCSIKLERRRQRVCGGCRLSCVSRVDLSV